MCSRKRKYIRKLQAFLCLVTWITLVSSDEVRNDFYALRDHVKGTTAGGGSGGGDLHNATTLIMPYEEEEEVEHEGASSSLPAQGGRHTFPAGSEARASHCPPSCFCEKEAGYAACVGDGQLAPPPILPVGLTRIELRGFFLPELGPAQLKVLPGIRELKINHCNLSLLVDNTFASLPDLDGLDMSENHLTMLGPYSFHGLKVLRHLDLSANRLTLLKRPFSTLSSLQHLNLHHNFLRSLVQDTFQGLTRVQYIDLDSNEISFLEVSAFQHLTSLAHLILSNNQLSTLATLDFFGSRLQYIDVSNIGIARVPQALTQFVRDLRLARNAISEIHRGDLDSYPYLTLLVLDNNNLEELEEDTLGRHEYLARLWLNGNLLINIPLSLPPSLQGLYLEENSIRSIQEGDFQGLINLQQLSLQHNNISVIANGAFRELISLKTLNLQGNHLTNLSGRMFSHLASLESLDLSQNPIVSLSGEALMGLTSVRVLQMSHILSQPTEIPDSLFDSLKGLWILELCESPKLVATIVNTTKMMHALRGLRELNLMHNGLAELREDFSTLFPKLQTIKLSGNSWDCSSTRKIMWMKRWMERSSVNFHRSYSIRCSSPLSVTYKPVILLEESDFTTTKISPDASSSDAPTYEPILLLNITSSSIAFLDNKVQENKENHTISQELSTLSTDRVLSIEINDGNNHDNSKSLPEISEEEESKEKDSSAPSSIAPSSMIQPSKDLRKKTSPEEWTTPSFIARSSTELSGVADSDWEKDIGTIHKATDQVPDFLKLLIPRSITTLQKTTTQIIPTATGKPFTSSKGISYPTVAFPPFLHNTILQTVASGAPTVSSETVAVASETESSSDQTSEPPSNLLSTLINKVDVDLQKKPVRSPPSNTDMPRQKLAGGNRDFFSHRKDLWLFRGDSNHGLSKGPPLPIGVGHGRVSDEAVMGAGVVATCLGIALFVGGFLLAQGRAKAGSLWESSSSSSYWREDGSGEDEVLMAVEDDAGLSESSLLTQAEAGVEMVTENHMGLNSRLYLLLQRDSSTGITPDSLPDPREYLFPQ